MSKARETFVSSLISKEIFQKSNEFIHFSHFKKSGTGRGRGRPRGSGRKHADLSFLEAHNRRSCVSDANEFEKLLQVI